MTKDPIFLYAAKYQIKVLKAQKEILKKRSKDKRTTASRNDCVGKNDIFKNKFE